MKVYISGPITGCNGYYEKFHRAERTLREAGYTPINPAAVNGELPAETSYEEYMKMSFCMLEMAEAIYMLPGWQNSTGANREYGFALGRDMKIMFEIEEAKEDGKVAD